MRLRRLYDIALALQLFFCTFCPLSIPLRSVQFDLALHLSLIPAISPVVWLLVHSIQMRRL